jgi:hypothetical protein
MAKICAVLLALALLWSGRTAVAADGAVTCALNKVIECTPDGGCDEWTPQDVSLPRFVRLDMARKKIVSLDKDVNRTSSIATVEQLSGLTVMHGTELRGWTMTLEQETGELTLSAAGPSEGFVVFGSCITP